VFVPRVVATVACRDDSKPDIAIVVDDPGVRAQATGADRVGIQLIDATPSRAQGGKGLPSVQYPECLPVLDRGSILGEADPMIRGPGKVIHDPVC
jgi:hypothetical protein